MLAKSRKPDSFTAGVAPSGLLRPPRPGQFGVVEPRPRPATLPERRAADLARSLAEACLHELAEPYRAVIRLRDLEGFSTAEVATRLGLRADLVAARLEHARRLFSQAVCRRCRPVA